MTHFAVSSVGLTLTQLCPAAPNFQAAALLWILLHGRLSHLLAITQNPIFPSRIYASWFCSDIEGLVFAITWNLWETLSRGHAPPGLLPGKARAESSNREPLLWGSLLAGQDFLRAAPNSQALPTQTSLLLSLLSHVSDQQHHSWKALLPPAPSPLYSSQIPNLNLESASQGLRLTYYTRAF